MFYCIKKNFFFPIALVFVLFFNHFPMLNSAPFLSFSNDKYSVEFQIRFRPETFFADNSNLLNNAVTSDWLFFNRGTFDLNSLFNYCADKFKFFSSIRNKATWGNAETIAPTSESEIKLLDAVFGAHRHFITRHIFWIRELWLQFSINDAFGLSFSNQHNFWLGAKSIELGRGISLGSAYAVNPRYLGFYADTSIDQYPYGFGIFGDIIKGKLRYDLWGEILENRSDSFTNTSLRIMGQEFGKKKNPERGPGKINFVIASRLRCNPIATNSANLMLEPYAMLNHAPEQVVEFSADSSSKLVTLGCAGEFIFGNFEFGFDGSKNLGLQKVKGWDRNKVEFQNRGGFAALINTRVVTQDPNINPNAPKVLFDPSSSSGKKIQSIINNSVQNASENGKKIGEVDGTQLYNDLYRFRNPYNNKYKGWMFVADAAYWFIKPVCKIAATFGIASGDESPNKNLDNPNDSKVDGDFKGFIGLQEIYSGNRVQSAFFLGGAGRVPRPLTVPGPEQGLDQLPAQISGFTNLIFVGNGLHWYPKFCGRSFEFRPNVLWYWQQHATKKFDILTGMSSPNKFARNYLGCEANIFSSASLGENLKLFAVSSVFIPGSHYTDIKGTPLNREQIKILDAIDVTGAEDIEKLPLLGTNIAYTCNVGLEYRY